MDQQISSELPPVQNQPANPNVAGMSLGETAQTESGYGRAVEQGVAPMPQPQSAQQIVQAVPQNPLAQSNPMPQNPSTQQLSAMPAIADDADLIEKEWVEKAKEIVERTKHDPYQQNKEVEKVKIEYLKKRYNKDIKLTED